MCECGKYFVIYKGDDTNFIDGQSLAIEIVSDIDLAGMQARFYLLGFEQTFNPIPSNNTLNVVIPHSNTMKFPTGFAMGTVVLVTPDDKMRTVTNSIPIKITNSIEEAYDNMNPNAITVRISSGDVDKIVSKAVEEAVPKAVDKSLVEGKKKFLEKYPDIPNNAQDVIGNVDFKGELKVKSIIFDSWYFVQAHKDIGNPDVEMLQDLIDRRCETLIGEPNSRLEEMI